MNRNARQTSDALREAGPPLSPLPTSPIPLEGGLRWIPALLLVAYMVLAISHAYLAPLGGTGYQNAPDEAAHVTYVRVVAAHRLPSRLTPSLMENESGGDANAPSYEWHQPPLYYWLDSLLLPFGERSLRSLSILCGVISLAFIYKTARRAFPTDPLVAIIALGIAALTPSHIAITSAVNNDAMLEACFSGALYGMTCALMSGLTPKRTLGIGIAIGMAVLAKATGILLFPLVFLAFLLLKREGESGKTLLRDGLAICGIALAICGGWLARNVSLYGELLPLRAFAESFKGTAQASTMAERLGGWGNYTLHVAESVFQSFWAVYGTPRDARYGIPRYLPLQAYLLLALATIAALIGLVRLHFQRKVAFSTAQQSIVLLYSATAFLVGVAFVAFLRQYYQTQGRYLYPAMLPIVVLFALGWRSTIPPRYINIASGFLLVLLAAFSLLLLSLVIPSALA